MEIRDVLYLPSGRIFINKTNDGYIIESTEMRDVAIDGKLHAEVRETLEPHKIWKHLVPYQKKWLVTVSTQKGCTHKCRFCSVANLPFKGNLTKDEIDWQIVNILKASPYVHTCEKVKIGFARMGEPAWNVDNVLASMKTLPLLSRMMDRDFQWLPCFNSILPRQANVLEKVIDFKESFYKGNLHLQVSCNSTDEEQRKYLFGGADVMTIEEIISIVNKTPISKRTVTLNFILMKGIEVSIEKLMKMGLNKEKFTVKLIPLNNTDRAEDNNLETVVNYKKYDELVSMGDEFRKVGIPVVVDAVARCENSGSLCCGQLAQIYL